MLNTFLSSVNQLESVSLQDLESVSLLNRIDSKYTLPVSTLNGVVACLRDNYYVLEIDGNRVFTYENNYFDTPDLQFYRDHHNGYLSRMKVRCRRYVESNLSFFEIKKKEKINRTNKHRVTIEKMTEQLNEYQIKAVRDRSRKELIKLELILKNNFNRITFVNRQFTERVTLDFNLIFQDNDGKVGLEEIVIFEVKQSKSDSNSAITTYFKQKNFKQQSFSKYIYGVINLKPSVKQNNFKPLIKTVSNLKMGVI